MRLLLASQSRGFLDALTRSLRLDGHAIDVAIDGQEAKELLRLEPFDAAVLSEDLDGVRGVDVLRGLRLRGENTPVLIITSRWNSANRVRLLDLGADDCVASSFDMTEIKARIRALLRRSQGIGTCSISLGALVFDTKQRRVLMHGEHLDLPRRELLVLEALLMHSGRIVGKRQLRNHVFALQDEAGDTALELYIHRLRRKLTPNNINIKTVRGVGYLIGA